MAEALKEFTQFLQLGARLDLKAIALENVLGLTGKAEGIDVILKADGVLVSLVSLLSDNSVPVAKDAALCLVNLSASEKGAQVLVGLNMQENCPPLQKPPLPLVTTLINIVFDEKTYIADQCCMILSNLSRPMFLIEKVIEQIEITGKSFDDLINIFTKNQYNTKGGKLFYLGPLLSNLSQSGTVRKYILDKEKCVIQRLLPFTEFTESLVKRGGVIGTLKNCCFESDYHSWLLSDDVDILPRLLLPLAGNFEYDDEDNDKLPIELQYLPSDKIRESDPDIRCILLEALTQLCTKKENREFIRNKNAYVILRELHKWEKDKAALLACENLVDILIRTEDEIDKENLKDLEVPDDLTERFVNMDKEFLES